MASAGTGVSVAGPLPSETVMAEITAAVGATLSPEAVLRRQAEDALIRLAASPGFSSALLHLVESPTAAPHVRQAAAVYLKNHTGRLYQNANWRAEAVADRATLKASLIPIMLRVPVLVRRQLSEVLAIIAEHEYPTDWPDLAPQLGLKLRSLVYGPSADWLAMQGILETLHAVFERYPWRERSNALYTEINFSLTHTQEPLLLAIQCVGRVLREPTLSSSSRDAQTQHQLLVIENAELLCKVFFCLSWQELPPYFEDNLAVFMEELRNLLTYKNPAFDDDTETEPTCVEKLQMSILETINLYESKHDEEFRPFLKPFVQDTWQLLTQNAESSRNDGVVTTGIKFLTTVARSPDYSLFSDPAALAQVCQQIVIPNIELRDDDIELFEDNPVEYIRRDMEGSDADTRRRGAVELVKGLCVHFERPVTEAFSSHVAQLLGPQSTWKQKDIALFIVTALGWKTGTAAGGVTETSALIDVLDFFRVHVLPSLTAFGESPGSLSAPIFTADIIKYVISFRNQIPKDDYMSIITSCVKLLQAKEPVVQTYAAACVERLLTVKDQVLSQPVGNGNGQATNGHANVSTRSIRTPRISPLDMRPILGALLPAVISALENSSRADEYLMRLLLRVITVSKTEICPHAQQILTVAAQVLSSIIQNPPNPLFCHYLFEVISALVSFSGNQSNVAMLEAGLVGHMQTILAQDLTEFGPYAFQVLSQLMALHSSELPSTYSDMIPPLLVPSMWDRRGYVRGMVLYLESYIKKDARAVVRDGRLEPILGVFNKLVASKATDHLGIQLLCTILEAYDAATMATYMNAIVRVLVTRLQAAKTPKYVQNLLYCLSLIVIRFGVETLVKSLDVLQQGLMAMLLSQVWINEVPSVMRPTDRRICAVAMADIACATDLCRTEPYMSLWSSMITATVALIEGVQTDAGDDVSDEEDSAPIETGEFYSGGHARLRWAAQAVPSGTGGVVTDIDPRAHLADRVASISARHPGVYATLIAQTVEQAAQNALQSYLVTSGRTIV